MYNMKKPNHICKVCGKAYWACNDCDNQKSFNPWRKSCDTQNCYLVYTTLVGYSRGEINKTEASKLLKAAKIDSINIASDLDKQMINSILTEVQVEDDIKKDFAAIQNQNTDSERSGRSNFKNKIYNKQSKHVKDNYDKG